VLIIGLAESTNANEGDQEPPISADDREHWSFSPLLRPPLPSTDGSHRPQNAIDHFIASAWQRKQIDPLLMADRMTLLRRVTFDLTGLPPTPDEIRRFRSDDSADAYERLVDRLLGSPRYGEHWAQSWLDLARFAETDGFEHDKVRPEAWRYRDWVIQALNADMPYDQFVSWQLAGDELQPSNKWAKIATTFCLAGPDMPDINLQNERKHYLLNSITSTVGSVLLGLQLECAQCHDHKYDPISQADFYRFRAIFEPAVRVKRNESVGALSENDSEAVDSYLMLRGDFRRRGPRVEPAFPRIANPSQASVRPQSIGFSSGRRAALARWITKNDHPLTARVFVNRLWQYHFDEGLSNTPSDFGVLGDEPLHRELLDWLAVELINQQWSIKYLQRLIVTSTVYRLASHPSHTGLAAQSSLPRIWANVLERDPNNLYFSRFPRHRLGGEAIRDAMLATAGQLNLRQGGPGVRPPLPAELVSTLLKNQWQVSKHPAEYVRRSVYVFARRNLRYPIFDVFDRPDGNASCAQRSQSTTAPQSLLLLNSSFSLEMARRLAGRVLAEARTPEQQVRSAVLRAFGRTPQEDESAELVVFLDQQAKLLRDTERDGEQLALPLPGPIDTDWFAAAALTDLCLALYNSSEFLYID
jgi:hypothetical protein